MQYWNMQYYSTYTVDIVTFLQKVPAFSLPRCPSDLSFLPPSPPHLLTTHTSTGAARIEEVTLPAGVELFSDPQLCDPVVTLSCLNYCGQQLVERRHVMEVCTYMYVYSNV